MRDEEGLAFYRRDISQLEEQVLQHFRGLYQNSAILTALRNVPRHLFVNAAYRTLAYTDHAFPTLDGLTTSAPSVIARMIFHAGVTRGARVLEIGTGTGYEAALLAEMGARVCTIEIDRSAAETASVILVRLGYKVDRSGARDRSTRRRQGSPTAFPRQGQVNVFWGNGAGGMPSRAPFDAIIVAASVPRIDQLSALVSQLSAHGGRLVAPVGPRHDQALAVIERTGERIRGFEVEGLSLDFLRLVIRSR